MPKPAQPPSSSPASATSGQTSVNAASSQGTVHGHNNTVTNQFYGRARPPSDRATLPPTAVLAAGRWRRRLLRPWLVGAGILALICICAGAGLVWAAPGVRAGCFTYGNNVFGDGPSAVVRADGACYGFTDSAAVGLREDFLFGRDPQAEDLQQRIFSLNVPVKLGPPRDTDLTVIWLSALSCTTYGAAVGTCADGRDYQAEREDLQGLLLAQDRGAKGLGPRIHVVLADAGENVQYADRVAELIVSHRSDFGQRVVAIGGDDSRTVTRRAINTLLDAGIPFIAHTLNADTDHPGQPFVTRPGYLQLGPSTKAYADDAIGWLSKRYPTLVGQLVIYQEPNPDDLYTTSLVADVKAAADASTQPVIKTIDATGLSQLGPSICRSTPAPSSQTATTTFVFFAARWSSFPAFVRRINDLCGASGPQLVMSDGSVSRFMNNDVQRQRTLSPWPLAYYTNGYQCSDLLAQNSPGATQLIDEAASVLSLDCRHGGQVGAQVAPVWDAVILADTLLGSRNPDDLSTLQGFSPLSGKVGSRNGAVTVSRGQVDPGTGIPVTRLCVEHLDRSPRSAAACDVAFPPAVPGGPSS